ncbi:hypothetical protein RHMOL_Rhmol09G0019800 [Rhododendron molle]|uniref:Uncharacterized protein n=1 Tax=Rhododendron molle TaxID=49168 RepID=A0ACC0M910_RHOML|nr:hypothetical protein RHMOL_Rhmol09G0019800 [Rhododendron molle]
MAIMSPTSPPPAPISTGGKSNLLSLSDEVRPMTWLRRRPARLTVPEGGLSCFDIGEMKKKKTERNMNPEFELEGRDFYLASRKGRREIMEDGYGVMLDILGDPKQAFFVVIDGHGGRAATDYVAENLGKNVMKALETVGEEEDQLQAAIHEAYLTTDKEFLSQSVDSGACCASVLFMHGHLLVANLGDCRVVMSQKGLANVLTRDHRPDREDERSRIERSGGYVDCRNGVWRVNGSLAVSRAVGDLHSKEWIIAEPEICKFPLTADFDFLIMASDGLWDKVNGQEAVDVVLREKNPLESCKKLVDISCKRGNIDDITVMVINVRQFLGSIKKSHKTDLSSPRYMKSTA